jgi:hypothetical protein
VFPNPSRDGTFQLCRQNSTGRITAEVFDLQGRKVMAQSIDDKTPDLMLYQLKSGVYFVRLTDKDSTTLSKIVRR